MGITMVLTEVGIWTPITMYVIYIYFYIHIMLYIYNVIYI